MTTVRRLLIIDDEDDIREVAALSLEATANWTILTANSGKQGIAVAAAEKPDAILMDVMMPEMDGPSTFKLMQQNPAIVGIPVVLLTARSRESTSGASPASASRASSSNPSTRSRSPRRSAKYWAGRSRTALAPGLLLAHGILAPRPGRTRSASRTEVHLVQPTFVSRTHFLPIACGPRALERKFVMPVRRLNADPNASPNLAHLKYQARDLLRAHSEHRPETAQTIREFHPRFAHAMDAAIFSANLRLGDAQLTIAREYGFPSWARLKRHLENPTLADRLDLRHHERIEDSTFRRAVDLLDAGDTAGLRTLLKLHPRLVHQHVLFEGGNYFRTPTLLEFIAENPVRHGRLPANIVAVARVILDAGPEIAARNETLTLVATGSVPREGKVQIPLIDLLCDSGADPGSAIQLAAVLDEHDSARALIRHGAKVNLPVTAALGLDLEFARQFKTATPDERHLALAVAAQFGRAELVRALLDAGEDPDRYNPPEGHAHATPLHQAAGAGHLAVVRLLVERGARLDLKDVLWHGTSADWAAHEGKAEVERYLRESVSTSPK